MRRGLWSLLALSLVLVSLTVLTPQTVTAADRDPADRRRPGPEQRAAGAARDLSGAGRDQHQRLGRRQHPGRRGHGGPPARGRLAGRRRPGAGAGAAQGQPGGALAGHGSAQAATAAGPPRRGRGPARGLDDRSVHARREGRLLLRARHQRRQGDGRDLRGHADPAHARGLEALARHHPGPDRRRGAGLELSVQRRALAPGQPPRTDRGGAGDQRGRRRRDPRRPAHGEPSADEREGADQLPTGGHEPRRPQLAAAQGQRHLPARRGPRAAGRLRVSRRAERHHPAVLRAHRDPAQRAARRRHARGGPDAARSRRAGPAGGRHALQQHAADDLRGHAPGGRPRQQRAAADGARHRQLPRPARREAGGRAGRRWCACWPATRSR